MAFTYIELFAGIGGFRQALGALGGKCVFASEIDTFARRAYRALYNGAPELYGDITKIDARDIPDHDLLVGGFPCQAFSVAGQRRGFEDARGTLFFEIARIASVKQPRLMLLENVKGLLSHDGGKTFETMCAILDDIGYAIDFAVLNSKYFGVPQNRERIFIVCDRDAEHEDWNVKGTDVVAKAKRRIAELGVRTFNFDWPTNNEVTTRLQDILETDVDEKYYLSDERTAALVAQLEGRKQSTETPAPLNLVSRGAESRSDDIAYCLKGAEGGSSKQHLLESEPQMLGHVDLKGHDAIKRVYSTEGISPTLTTMGGGHREPKIAEPITVQMNRNAISGESDVSHCLMARDYKGFGNQDMTGVIEEVRPVLTPDREEKRQDGRRFKEDGEEAFTLTTQDKHGVAIGKYPRYRIRKLTPLECWRLQGFPDAAHEAVKAAGVSDSQRYKQAGNAVTVNVIRAIGNRLIPLIDKEFIAAKKEMGTK